MKPTGVVSGLLAGAVYLASGVAAQSWNTIDPIIIKGQHFFYKTNGTEFQMRGVAYQQGVETSATGGANGTNYNDPLADASACTRDIPYLVRLQTNIIRVYAIDPTKDHDECMRMLADAGIYVIADLSEPQMSINRDVPQWDVALYQRYTGVVDSLQKYKNTLGFFAGNEVSNEVNTTAASAFVKAAVRDTKAYIKNQNYRPLGVGYATYDGDIRDQLAQFFNCGPQEAAIDFWGYNVYSWCGNSSYTKSGFDQRVDFFSKYSVPIFLAEYGCNEVEPRPFTEVGALYTKPMADTFSGGIVYMYFQEENNYGLVSIDGNEVKTREDFNNLSREIAMVTPTLTNARDYSVNFTPTSCPATGPSWSAVASPLPPPPNAALCNCQRSTLACVANTDNELEYGDLFNFICGAGDYCRGITANATTGEYGAYSGCNPKQQLDWVMNRYYVGQGSRSSACAFSGKATLKSTSSATGSCVSLLQQAGTNGAGTVASPTGNSAQQASAAGSSGSGSGAISNMQTGASWWTVMTMGAYVSVAIISGAGMLLL